ncbi:MAG: molybdopterin-dependent oxidoreductase [Magnetococcales bacterium]|nr:molybdopterin-dependent oxidoreductase [Magnetococcales bacterium]
MALREFPTTCPLDCPSACALIATIADGRLLKLTGDPSHPFTRGVICSKVANYHRFLEGERLTRPLLRSGPKGSGHFREITWDEALDRIAAGLSEVTRRHGAEAVFPYHYGGTMGVVQRNAPERLTHRAGYSRLEKNICYNIAEAGWLAGVGKAWGPNPAAIADSDLPVLWGINAVSTHLQLMGFVTEARRRGAPLVVVDPYRNRTARQADLHLSPRPGTDGALAVALLHLLLVEGYADTAYLAQWTDYSDALRHHLESRTPAWAALLCGVPEADIRRFAHLYGRAKRPFIRIGLGMSRHRNGAVNLHAVSCLPALTGAWRRGGGALFATGDAFGVVSEPVIQSRWRQERTRILDMSRLGALLTDEAPTPGIHALLVFNANPAGSAPDLGRVWKGLRREDLFTVVHELVMSDTARLADLVLPATSFLEHEDLYKSYGQYTLQHAGKLLEPVGEARSNNDTVNALARRLGFDEPPFQWDAGVFVEQVLEASGLPRRVDWPGRWLDRAPTEAKQYFREGFPQEDGRFHFQPGWADATMPRFPDHWPVNARDRVDSGRYPLDFMTPPAHHILNTTFTASAWHRSRRGRPLLWIHPADARRRGIGEGDAVVVFNDQGSVTMWARVTEGVREGLCVTESNYRGDELPGGIGINLLTSADRVAPAGGAAFHDNRVEVRRL